MKKKKAKAVPHRFIEPGSEEGERLYELLRVLIEEHHQDILDARIALAWHTGWTPDADGRLKLGMCRKSADLEREIQQLAAFDFVILLNQHFWTDELVSDAQRLALLDHELCHATVQLDKDGKVEVNERGRTVYRIRKHDLEEFGAIVERYGCWKRDIEAFASSLARARQANLWIGFSGLRAELLGVGAAVPLETVCQWSEAERKEAAVWAATVKGASGSMTVGGCPAHVWAALQQPSVEAWPPDRPGPPGFYEAVLTKNADGTYKSRDIVDGREPVPSPGCYFDPVTHVERCLVCFKVYPCGEDHSADPPPPRAPEGPPDQPGSGV